MKKLALNLLSLDASIILTSQEKKQALGGYAGCTDELCAARNGPSYVCECGMCWDKHIEHPCPSW